MTGTVKTKKVGADLTSGPIFKALLAFVVPIILTDLIQQLYSLVDLLVIGQFMGSTGTVGVSTGGEISDMLTPVATAFGAAGQIYIGQLVGAKEEEKLKKAIGTLITLMTVGSLIFMAVTLIFRNQILTLLNCPSEAFGQAVNYMIITAIGFPFIFGYNAICGTLRGMGESRRPLLFIIIAAVVNIFLDILLVGPFHMEAAGTAIATAMSQMASCIAALIYMNKHKERFDFELKLSYFKIHKEQAKVILTLGIPQAIRSLLVRVSMLYVNACVNAYGLTESATNSVGNKLQKFLEVYTSSFSQAASAMVAQNLGAKKHDRAARTVLYSCASCLVLASVSAFLIIVFPRQVFGIFTKDVSVIDMGVIYLRILVIHLFLSAITSTFQSMVIGSGFASMNFMIGILDGVVCKIGLAIVFARALGMGVEGYWWGTALSRLIPGAICVWYLLSGKWKTRKLLTEDK